MTTDDDERQPESLSRRDARRVIADIASDSSRVVFLPHAKARMRQRFISRDAALAVLSRGMIVEGPYTAPKSGNWRVEIAGRSGVSCVVEIEWRTAVLLVTVF